MSLFSSKTIISKYGFIHPHPPDVSLGYQMNWTEKHLGMEYSRQQFKLQVTNGKINTSHLHDSNIENSFRSTRERYKNCGSPSDGKEKCWTVGGSSPLHCFKLLQPLERKGFTVELLCHTDLGNFFYYYSLISSIIEKTR